MATENPAIVLDKVKVVMGLVTARVREKELAVENLIKSAESTHNKVLQMLNDQIDQLELEKVGLRSELDKQLVATEDLVGKLETAEANRQASDSKLEGLERENEGLSGLIDSLKGEIKGLKYQKNVMTVNLQDQQKNITKLDNEKSALAEENDLQRKKMHGELQRFNTETGQLKAQVGTLQTELERAKSEASAKLSQLTSENNELTSRLEKTLREKQNAEARAQKIQASWDQQHG